MSNNTRKNKNINLEEISFKELYPQLELSFSEAQEWLIDHLDSAIFKKRDNAGDTISSIPILQKIVKEGMITENSQEGTISKSFNKESKMFYKIKERAYLSGFMKHAKSFKFVDWINTYTDKVAFIPAIVPKNIDTSIRKNTTSIAVTIGTSSKTQISENNYTKETSMPQYLDEETFHNIKKNSNIKKDENVYLICIFDPKYGRLASSKDGLYSDVLKALKIKA